MPLYKNGQLVSPGLGFPPSSAPAPHKTSHENGGTDEVSVAGLSGVLADPQVAGTIRETSGPTSLVVGAVSDGQVLKRVGSTVVGVTALTKTIASMIVYADSVAGNDANDGLSALTAKATPAAALAVLPDQIDHPCSLNIVGNITVDTTVSKIVNSQLYIDGGYTNVTPQSLGGSGVGPFTCDIASSTSIGLSTIAGLATDTYEGYWIEITAGTGVGQRRKIFSHTATTFVPARNWNTVPVAGSSVFQVVAPSTNIEGNLQIACSGSGTVVVQQLFLQRTGGAGGDALAIFRSACPVLLQGIMCASVSTFAAIQARQGLSIGFSGGYTNPLTFVSGAFSTVFTGVSNISSRRVLLSGTQVGGIFALSSRGGLEIYNCWYTNIGMDLGSRIRGKVIMQAVSPLDTAASNALFGATAGYQVSQVDGASGVGIQMFSVAGAVGPIVISNCTSHGLELNNSYITLTAGLSGTGNTGAGAYVRGNSTMYTKAGTAPTITGLVGDLAVDSPIAAISTWAAIEAGTPVNSLNEMVVVRRL